jgi:hypothetical protein
MGNCGDRNGPALLDIMHRLALNSAVINNTYSFGFQLKKIQKQHLLGLTKLYKEKNQCIRKKNGSREYSKGNKTVPGKVATTHTEDGHKQDT